MKLGKQVAQIGSYEGIYVQEQEWETWVVMKVVYQDNYGQE